ncbi:hypothetical protein E1A91_A10G000300v1 [Gossypium mustelinum]|nr:hypothetical protein E1A91_A10G000300v1 [Gossypium mustelinum]
MNNIDFYLSSPGMSPAIKLHRFVPSSSVEFWLRSTPGITSYLEKSGFGFYVIHILCSFWKMLLSFCVSAMVFWHFPALGGLEYIYNHWPTNIKDWCISRQLWWGHRIPVWYIVGKDCEEEYIVARSAEEALRKACDKYGKDVEVYQDPDVLDTWFSR